MSAHFWLTRKAIPMTLADVALEPRINKQGPRWSDVEEYFQFIESELEERSVSEALQRIDKLQKTVDRLNGRK